jgi:nucleotidyltransferase substrate binding protein (TIGR01987 family)
MTDNYKEIRWKQRFQNLDKAFKQLKDAVSRHKELDDLSLEGLIQRFEYTFELSWKTLKDFLESKGENVRFTRDVIKKSFQLDIIDDGEVWLEMLEKRNIMAHTYNEKAFKESINQIVNKYYFEIEKLVLFLEKENE